jgi:threonine synthase
LNRLYLKEEGVSPTGTFKARGMAVALSRAAELGAQGAIVPTAGNAGGAAAAYGARVGMPIQVYMPADAPLSNQGEVHAAGGDLQLVDGTISEAGKRAAAEAKRGGWMNLATFREPYRVEGKKTMGLELADEFDWDFPEAIIYPTGGGTGLVGMWKAFDELAQMGWVASGKPKMFSVQTEGCDPIVRAVERGADRAEASERADTRIPGLRVPKPYADRLILRALRESGGTAVAVSDEQADVAQVELAQEEGVHACPEGAAGLAGLVKLVEAGLVDQDERVVLFNTGSGLKYLS